MKKWILVLPITMGLATFALAQDTTSTESGSTEVVEVDCDTKVTDYLSSKGWSAGENKNGKLIVVVGEASTSRKPGEKGYLNSRKTAFTRAMLEAKKQMSETLGKSIARNITDSYTEPDQAAQWEAMEAKNAAAEAPTDLTLMDKGMMLLHNELDQQLDSRGIDTSTPEGRAEAKVALVTIMDTSFSDVVKVMANNEVAGLTAFKTFECQPKGEQGTIAVVCVLTEKTRQMSAALLGRGPALKNREAGKKPSLRDQLPDDASLACSMGVQQRIDENGNFCIIAFGQGIPVSNSSTGMNGAKTRAGAAADGAIRSFAGEMVGVSTVTESAESYQELNNAAGELSSVYADEQSLKAVTNASAAELDISGISRIFGKKLTHPITGESIYVVVHSWSPASADRANVLRGKLDQLAGSKGGSGRTNTAPASGGKGKNKPKGSGASGSGEGAEGDDDGVM